MKQTTAQFDFSAKPKVTTIRPKFRDEERAQGNNLMNDARVIRGNTYAAIIANKNQIIPPPPKKVAKEPTKKFNNRRINFDTGFEPTTPRPVAGRDHFTCQTEPFVETLRDKPIQYEKQCQTDLFLDRPAERLFNAMDGKTGVDFATQIIEDDPELFNFDYEVQPILDALLSKVVETSRMQLFQEEQLKEKQKEKIEYEKRRHSRLAEAQKLEANEERLKEEYERRQLQYRKSKEQENAAEKKVIGRIISKHCLKNLKENTEMMLEHQGFFRHPLELNLFERFVPWAYQEIENQLNTQTLFEEVLGELCLQGQMERLKESQEPINEENRRRMEIKRQEERKRLEKIARKKEKEEEERLRKQQQQKEKEKQQKQAEEQKKDDG